MAWAMVQKTGKDRDKAKVQRKKARLRASKQAWRETHGFETDPETLVESAFGALERGRRAPKGNPFSETAARFQGSPRTERAAAKALVLVGARFGLADHAWQARLLALLSWRRHWQRRPGDWVAGAESANADATFRALLHWLLARYPVPPCFEEPFLRDPRSGGLPRARDPMQRWFIDLAQGKNLRQCQDLPFALTKRMAHSVVHAPPELNLFQALRWGQVRGLGGREALAQELCAAPICRPMASEAEDFWRELIELLVQDRFLARRQIRPLVDYLRYQRFGELGPGQAPQRVEAPRPGLSVRRRRLAALVGESAAWCARVQQVEADVPVSWCARGWGSVLAEGRFEELTSTYALVEEGETLAHCVATYAASCAAGRTAVLGFRPTVAKPGNRLTLLVDTSEARLREVRGLANRFPSEREWDMIERWAKTHRIAIPLPLRRSVA